MQPPEPPEFIVDRCLGRRTVAQLRELGWCVHHLGDVYPDDGQDIADEEWIAFAAQQGWAVLTQEERIRYRAVERGALTDDALPMFCLSNGNLRLAEKVELPQVPDSHLPSRAKSRDSDLHRVRGPDRS